MNVLVTGGAGSVGRFVVEELQARGHQVTVCGRRVASDVDTAGAAYRRVDITDFAAVHDTVREFDSVVHLAAIPSPRPGHEFSANMADINIRGTYNVYEACAAAGIKKIAVASSINAVGNRFGNERVEVKYLPIDEDHPQRLSDPYSFSKHVTEECGEYFWKKDGISSVSLRIPAVLAPTERRAEGLRRARAFDGQQEPPEQSRGGWRREYGRASFALDFWTIVDARDSARAFADGIEADYTGFHVLFANDCVNALGLPSRELAAEFYPECDTFTEPLEADETLVSIRRIKDVLGWEPKFSWKGVAEGGPLP